jgi:hypothetical protein
VLTVPRSAVIDRGNDKVVYVQLPDGIFQRRTIAVGIPGKDSYPVLKGLAERERVATNGAFLIDSQIQLGGVAAFNPYASTASAPGNSVNPYKISVDVSPQPAAGKETNFLVTISDTDGQPVRDAQVRLTLVMPAMPAMGMPEMRTSLDLQGNVTGYTGSAKLSMAGSWNLLAEARRGSQILATSRMNLSVR